MIAQTMRERERENFEWGKKEQTIIEDCNNKHHERWKVELPYEGQQHETHLPTY